MDLQDDMAEYAALITQIATLQQQAATMLPRIKARAAAAVRAIMAENGLTPEQLLATPKKQYQPRNADHPDGPLPARYRHPDGRTWSGMGRAPSWVTDAADSRAFLIA